MHGGFARGDLETILYARSREWSSLAVWEKWPFEIDTGSLEPLPDSRGGITPEGDDTLLAAFPMDAHALGSSETYVCHARVYDLGLGPVDRG